MKLEALLKQPRALPTAPDAAARLIETFYQEDVDTQKVADYIAMDPVLTAKLLKQANSAFFGLARAVSTVREAMNMLGLIKVRALVIGAVLDQSFHAVPGMKLEQFWSYSLNTANLSRYIAKPIKIDENTAFTAGLVHSIGELIMHVGMPEAMAQLNETVEPLSIKRADAERSVFGYCYADAGAALAKDWKFPKPMVDAIRHQIAPFENDTYEPIAGVIHMAAWRARAEERKLSGQQLIVTYPDEIGEVLGVDPDSLMDDVPVLQPNR